LPYQLLTASTAAFELLRSLQAMTAQEGVVPRWPQALSESGFCMVGMHAASLCFEGVYKGYFSLFDVSVIH
jgi:hypothetical protein